MVTVRQLYSYRYIRIYSLYCLYFYQPLQYQHNYASKALYEILFLLARLPHERNSLHNFEILQVLVFLKFQLDREFYQLALYLASNVALRVPHFAIM